MSNVTVGRWVGMYLCAMIVALKITARLSPTTRLNLASWGFCEEEINSAFRYAPFVQTRNNANKESLDS